MTFAVDCSHSLFYYLLSQAIASDRDPTQVHHMQRRGPFSYATLSQRLESHHKLLATERLYASPVLSQLLVHPAHATSRSIFIPLPRASLGRRKKGLSRKSRALLVSFFSTCVLVLRSLGAQMGLVIKNIRVARRTVRFSCRNFSDTVAGSSIHILQRSALAPRFHIIWLLLPAVFLST